MNFFRIGFLIVAGLLLIASSCQTETPTPAAEGQFEFNINARVGGQRLEKFTTFENIQGRKFFIEDFRLYIGDLTLVKEDGSEVLISEVMLFDLDDEGVKKTAHGEGVYKIFDVEPGRYKGIKFGLGVPERFNHTDPSTYPDDHPLAAITGMNWTWASGYRFAVVEGRIDSSANKEGLNIDHSMAYHTGLDTLYRTMEYLEPQHAFTLTEDQELQWLLEIDLNRMFYTSTDTIDMVKNNITHSMPPGSPAFKLAEKITNNLANNAIYKVPF